ILKRSYLNCRAMSHSRLMAELYARGDMPHPIEITLESCPTFPGKYNTVHRGNEILLTSSLEFGRTVFPEFASFSDKERWDIVVDFFYRFRSIEGCLRANEKFPGHPDRFETIFHLSNNVFRIDSSATSLPTSVLTSLTTFSRINSKRVGDVIAARVMMQRFDPMHEEFLAIVGMMFWSIGDVVVSEEIRSIAQGYRTQILRELHSFYREELQLDNYATRLGELLLFLQVFEIKYEYREHFELLRLLNLINDDNCVYRMQK
ncbi:hypothetical protein PFISCL1PPCAC_14292, partial [Pristionchus fissidentatus]